MPKPYVFLCFDTEDPIHPEADDAVLDLARALDSSGLRGCFFMVGEKARTLRARARRDVLEALAPHEISYHGNHWFEFPEPALVYGNRDPWDSAVATGLRYELPGIRDVAEIAGQFPVAFCQHQNNYSVATSHALECAGIKVWNGGFGAEMPGIAWVMGLLMVPRHSRSGGSLQGSWGRYRYDPDAPSAPPPMDPAAELRHFQVQFDAALERGDTHVNLVGHPTCWAIADWWGWYEWGLPFQVSAHGTAPGPYPAGRRWERGTVRTGADRAAHLEWTVAAARWLAARNDIRVATFDEVLREHAEPAGIWLSAAQVQEVARVCAEGVRHLAVDGVSLSAADALYVLAQFVAFLARERRRPAAVQVRRPLGPVEPIRTAPGSLGFLRPDLLLGARLLVEYVDQLGRLPAALRIHSLDCGPAELLLALARALLTPTLPESITIESTAGLPESAALPCFSHAAAASTHSPAGYTSDQIAWQARQQSWSYRPAIRVS